MHLVNDQMSRLRRVLSLNGSPDWQRRQLARKHDPLRHVHQLDAANQGPEQSSKRREFDEYMQHLEEEWESLNGELRSTGNWPVTGARRCCAAGTCRGPRRTSWSPTTPCWSTCSSAR